jgi:KAP family P-loop domain
MTAQTVSASLIEYNHIIETTGSRSSLQLTDRLDRAPMARLLAERLLDEPGVVGVFGSWGSGKSFLLDLTISQLFERPPGDLRRPIVCYFQPWRYEPDTSLAPGLINALSDVTGQFPGNNPDFGWEEPGKLRTAAARLLWLVQRAVGVLEPVAHVGAAVAGQLPPGTLPASLAVAPAVIAGIDATAAALDALPGPGEPGGAARPDAGWDPDQIKNEMGKLIEHLRRAAADGDVASGRKADADDYRVVVIIDDLDRCAPDLLVDMLNWLKVHLSVPGCSYLLALDHGAAAKAIVGRYRAYLGESAGVAYGLRYLEKIVDFEVELGQSRFVEQMAAQAVMEIESVVDIIERLIDRQGVRLAETRRLIRLPTLQSPRTMLKVVSRYVRVLREIQRDQERGTIGSSEARQLPADYSFWLLLLVTMYYRLAPWQIEAFCHGQGPLASPDGKDPGSADTSEDPLPEFRGFLDSALRDSQGERIQPTPAVLLYLYTAVRQLVVPSA